MFNRGGDGYIRRDHVRRQSVVHENREHCYVTDARSRRHVQRIDPVVALRLFVKNRKRFRVTLGYSVVVEPSF